MDQRNVPWKAEWKASGLDPGPLSPEEEALVPQLVAENKQFLEAHPYRPLRAPKRPFVSPLWALPLAAAAAVLLFVLPPSGSAVTGTSLERMKGAGDPVLTVYRQGKAGTEKLLSGATVRPGDVLQASYRVTQTVQGALLSVDGGGNVTIHLAQEGHSVALAAGPERPLEFSYELDRAPRYEVFFLLVSPRPFDLEPIRQTLKSVDWQTLKPGAFGPEIKFVDLPLTKDLAR